jgi:adenylate cyclase
MNWAEAKPIVERAIELDPTCYEAHHAGGNGNITARNYPEAIRCFERALAIDPDSYRAAGMVIQAYVGIGDTENAEAAARRSLALCERVLAREPDHSGALGFFVSALADLGQAERARTWAQRAVLFVPDEARMHYNLACAMASLGDADAACELLEGIVDGLSEGAIRWMAQDNGLDPIRAHPRFVALTGRADARLAKKPKRRDKRVSADPQVS